MYWYEVGQSRYKKALDSTLQKKGYICIRLSFSHNPLYCVDIIKTYKPDFTPRVAFILGSGLGALADQIENAVAISYEKAALGSR